MFCIQMCTVMHTPPCVALGLLRGTPCGSQSVVQVPSPGAFLQCLLGQLVSHSWESWTEMAWTQQLRLTSVRTLTTLCLCLLSLAWWCHLVLLGQLIYNIALHGISGFVYEILGCAWMAHRYLDASLWSDGTCLNNIPPWTVMEMHTQRCWKLHLRQGEGMHEGIVWDLRWGIKEPLDVHRLPCSPWRTLNL